MASYLITGFWRGVGLEVTRIQSSFCPDAVRFVFATARGLSPALKDIVDASNNRVCLMPLDVLDDTSIDSAAIQKVTPEENSNLRQIYVEGSEVYDGKYTLW